MHFVERILFYHGLILLAVLALVALASAEIYNSTRERAISEAQTRQELLTDQTCRGISTFYSAIISDLGWIQHRQILTGRGNAQFRPGGRGGPGTNGNPSRPPVAAGANPLPPRDRIVPDEVANQLGTRVSGLFTYDKTTGKVITSIVPKESPFTTDDLSPQIKDWLAAVNNVNVSRFMPLKGHGVSLVAASFGPDDPTRLLVAVVPGSKIESTLLPVLNDKKVGSATLADSQLQVVASSNPDLEGKNLQDLTNNSHFQAMLTGPHVEFQPVTELFPQPLSINGAALGGRMMTLEPVTVANDQWMVLFAYPVGQIDSEVNALFKRAVIWAAFVAISITAVLLSTAIQTIRFQARFERERHKVLTRELTQARRIQEQWLPDIASAPPQLDVAALNLPASHISGDFYNWFELADGRHVVVIGDVTGHGMAAAFLMATTQLLVHNTMARLGDPGPALAEVNRQLTSQVFHGQFVTMLILVLDFDHHQMEVASAGHPAPLIGENEMVRKLDLESQLVLGVEKDVVYPTQRFDLPELSSLFLFTDGVIDARGRNDERFGSARLISSLSGHLGSAQEMVDAVATSVRQFGGGQEPDDDLTLVAIQLRKSAVRSTGRPPSLTLPARS